MRAYIFTAVLGVVAVGENGEVLAYRLFPAEAEEIARRLADAKVLAEEQAVIEELAAKGYTEIVFGKEYAVPNVRFMKGENKAAAMLQAELRPLALKLKWVTSPAELNRLLTTVQNARTTQTLQQERKDTILMRAVSVRDELDHETNVLSEMIREWYGLHRPEIGGVPGEEVARMVSQKPKGPSRGMPFSPEDRQAVLDAVKALETLVSGRDRITGYIEQMVKEVAPNIAAVAGPVLAARFLVHAGGLDKLARLPSSTIQILGAEKALFRHLREHTKAPKYGILFAHPAIQQAPAELRGKVARLIAAKLALAARMDFFTKNDQSASLKKALEKDITATLGKKVVF